MHLHMYILFLAALIPLAVGMLWYSKALFGDAWMRVNRFSPEDMTGYNMVLVFGLVYVFSVFVAFVLMPIVIHQFGLTSMLQKDKTEASRIWLEDAMNRYGGNFRTFKHGMLHGFITSVGLALPVIGISALFEKRGAKYIFIHFGFWAVTLMLMGGVICQWL